MLAIQLPQQVTGHAPGPRLGELITILGLPLLVGGLTGLVERRRRGRASREPAVTDERRARAVMGELCPGGWQAQITVYGWGAPVPPDAPPARHPQVSLDWVELRDDCGSPAVVRRVWADSIPHALQAMVEDRRTDLALEEIERRAGDGWPA